MRHRLFIGRLCFLQPALFELKIGNAPLGTLGVRRLRMLTKQFLVGVNRFLAVRPGPILLKQHFREKRLCRRGGCTLRMPRDDRFKKSACLRPRALLVGA